MNTHLATMVTGLVTDENTDYYFVPKDGVTFALAKQEGTHKLGDMVEGFVYTDKHQKKRMTTLKQEASLTSYGWGVVTEVRRDLGVFVDTGLPDKEVAVSLDVLPDLKDLWPKKGDKLYVRYELDKKERLWAIPPVQRSFKSWHVLPMTICKTKPGLPLSIVSSCLGLLSTCLKTTC